MGVFPSSMAPSRSSEPLRRAATAALVAAVAGPTLWLGGAPPGAAVLAALLSATALGLLVAADRAASSFHHSRSFRSPSPASVPSSSSRFRPRSPASSARPSASSAPSPSSRSASTAGARSLTTRPPPPPRSRARSPPPPPSSPPPGSAARAPAAASSPPASASPASPSPSSASATRSRTPQPSSDSTDSRTRQLPFLTPFGNPNHLAAFATLASALLLGLAADSHPDRPRQALWLAAAVAVGAAAFLSLSRGGIAFWCAGQLAFLLLLLRRRDARGTTGRAIPVALAVGTVAFVAGYLALDRIGSELATVDTVEKLRHSKVDLWPMFSRPALAAWLTGLGRGTFAIAFPRWQTAHSTLTFTFEYPENLPLQLATELGLPATLGLLALAAWATVRTARARNGKPLVLAAWAGVGALVLHDLFDFALELPACATAAAVALGIASGPWVEQHERPLRRTPALAGLAAAALLAVLGLVRRRRLHRPRRGHARRPRHAATPPVSAKRPALSWTATPPTPSSTASPDGPRPPAPAASPVSRSPGSTARSSSSLSTPTPTASSPAPCSSSAPPTRPWSRSGSRSSPAPRSAAILAESLPAPATSMRCGTWSATRPRTSISSSPSSGSGAGPRTRARLLDRALLTFAGRPEATALTVTAARVRLQTGDPAGALVFLDEAEQKGQDVALPRAQALAALGRRRDAIRTLESAVARNPGDAEIAFALAGPTSSPRAGPPSPAPPSSVSSPSSAAGGPRTRLVLAQADTYRVEGRHGRALDLVQTAMRLSPGDPGSTARPPSCTSPSSARARRSTRSRCRCPAGKPRTRRRAPGWSGSAPPSTSRRSARWIPLAGSRGSRARSPTRAATARSHAARRAADPRLRRWFRAPRAGARVRRKNRMTRAAGERWRLPSRTSPDGGPRPRTPLEARAPSAPAAPAERD